MVKAKAMKPVPMTSAAGPSLGLTLCIARLGVNERVMFELWIGDAAAVRTNRVRKQKTDRQDAQLLLQLLRQDRFPRIWIPDTENRDLRQLLWHRHRLVQMRTRIMNELHVVALNERPAPQASFVAAGRAPSTGVVASGPVG